MRVESSAQLPAPTTFAPIDELPVIKADQIRSILYLGVRGTVRPQADAGQTTVDTYA